MAFLLLLACGGAAGEGDEPVDAMVEAAPDAPAETVVPLCEGSAEQTPALCQELRYGLRGYCNYWHECASH